MQFIIDGFKYRCNYLSYEFCYNLFFAFRKQGDTITSDTRKVSPVILKMKVISPVIPHMNVLYLQYINFDAMNAQMRSLFFKVLNFFKLYITRL